MFYLLFTDVCYVEYLTVGLLTTVELLQDLLILTTSLKICQLELYRVSNSRAV